MKKQITFEIDESIASKAEAIYLSLGMDTEMALGLFMRRTVLESGLPLDMNAAVSPPQQNAATQTEAPADDFAYLNYSKPRRTNISITQDMVETLWDEFKDFVLLGGNIREIANGIGDSTGMNPGSAFIYLTMLNNLVDGSPNKRNMKMKDLEFYMEKIKGELGEAKFENALQSLEDSIPYWDGQNEFGFFATHVRDYVKKHRR